LSLAGIFKKKIVNHLHGCDFLRFYENSGWLKKFIKWSYSKIDTNIILLPSMKNQFSEFPNSKIEVIANCYSSEFNSYRMNVSEKKTQVTFLSNLLYSKGVFVFLDAACELLNLNEDVIVKIAGMPMGDDYMSAKDVGVKFMEESKKLKRLYPERYHYLGGIKGRRKENLLKESSIFVLPSFYKTEGFPLSIIEAMYYGNAVVTTDHNYLGDIISMHNGFLVKPCSHEEIVRSISVLLNDKTKLSSMQRFNHNEAVKRYNPRDFDNRVGKIINQL
jgi:glycosyltransferase involved in cell wall biosynthesis